MTFFNKILLLLSKQKLRRNKRFKGIHSGESCYIFGNGVSLKYFDLKEFNDRVSIGCNMLFTHRNVNELNLKYYYMGHTFLFYKYWKNPYSFKYQRNMLGPLYRKKIKLNSHAEYFTSLSNCFGLKGANINYLHHFGTLHSRLKSVDFTNSFSSMDGGLDGMLGIAIYMGFKDIILVGCDYLSFPKMYWHFFESGESLDWNNDEVPKKELLLSAKKEADIKILTVDNNYKSDILPCMTYHELTNKRPVYKENTQLVSDNDLMFLDKTGMRYLIKSNAERKVSE
jgi:hypothetical protein